ncbi:MAG: signal recognition particle-docking protein FtsY [Candidatus Ranarchaeia archaeon]
MFQKLKQGINKAVEKITTTDLKGKKLDDLLWELQLVLIQNDVAVETAESLCDGLRGELTGEKIKRFSNPYPLIIESLRTQIRDIFTNTVEFDLFKKIEENKKNKKPTVIVFVGINGTGKTTTISKLTSLLLKNKISVVLAAGDTFRAGSIEQIEEHARRLNVKVIKHNYGSDSASVVFDAIQHANARYISVVLVDTAGRMQTNKNLIDEMRKIIRVNNPDAIFFVGDSLAGNDALSQAKEFNKAIGITGTILTKIDADSKGGAALSIAHSTGKPIVFIGVGQEYDDIEKFDVNWFIEKILPV